MPNSRDANGKYCGLVEATGERAPAPIGKVGFCGPTCPHCATKPEYVLEDGIWVCVADSSYVER